MSLKLHMMMNRSFMLVASFGMSIGFKLNGNSLNRHAFSALTLTVSYVYQEV